MRSKTDDTWDALKEAIRRLDHAKSKYEEAKVSEHAAYEAHCEAMDEEDEAEEQAPR